MNVIKSNYHHCVVEIAYPSFHAYFHHHRHLPHQPLTVNIRFVGVERDMQQRQRVEVVFQPVRNIVGVEA
jgi:hypothetical protein